MTTLPSTLSLRNDLQLRTVGEHLNEDTSTSSLKHSLTATSKMIDPMRTTRAQNYITLSDASLS